MFSLVKYRGFNKGGVQGKLTGCEDDFAHLVWPSRGKFFLERSKVSLKSFARLWKPVALLTKMLMKPLPNGVVQGVALHLQQEKPHNSSNNTNNTNKWYYYMAVSHKDWELPNSRIWLAEINIDHGLYFPI